MALLCLSRLLVALVPFGIWRGHLGAKPDCRNSADLADVRRLAAHIERAAWRLPFAVKCLPQAMALSWQLRRRGLCHQIVFAVRPPHLRGHDDALHAWIACSGEVVLGALDGPWLPVHVQSH